MTECRSAEEFRRLTERDGVVIAEFGSAHCPPCRDIRRKIGIWLESHPEAGGIYVPVEDAPDTAAQNDVFTAPAVRVYVNGRPTVSESGYFSLDLLLDRAERYIGMLG